MGLLNLLEASVQAHGRRFVFASSGGACYGEQQSFPATENHPLQPVSPYGVSKAASELYLGYYFTEKKLPYVALRYSNRFIFSGAPSIWRSPASRAAAHRSTRAASITSRTR